MAKKILLAYSGGLDTSAIIPWLIETYNAQVICYCSDLGNAPDAKAIGEKARQFGAVDFIFEDVRETFLSNFISPMVRAGALYQNEYLLGTAIARPLIAERVAHFAKKFKVDAVAHGATGKGNDQIRFERAWAYLIPKVEIIAPWKIWAFQGRQDLVRYLRDKKFPVDEKENRFSRDSNLFHNSTEGEILEDPTKEFNPQDVYLWTKTPEQVPHEKHQIQIEFQKGLPQGGLAFFEKLNTLGGLHGLGVVDLVEERTNGLKSRGIYETPGGTLLYMALAALKQLCWPRELHEVARYLSGKYGDLIYDGLWHSPSREALEAFFKEAGSCLTGTVTLELNCGKVLISSRKSPHSLYQTQASSFEGDAFGINKASDGFSRTLRYKQLQAGLLRDRENH